MDEKHLARFWSRVDRRGPDECWPWLCRLNKKGYGTFWDGTRTLGSARAVLIIVTGKDHKHLQTRHLCHCPACCNPRHLRWGTGSQNVQDSVRDGRRGHLVGETHNRALLSEADVLNILEAVASGETIPSQAERYGVCKATVSHICTGRNWKRVYRSLSQKQKTAIRIATQENQRTRQLRGSRSATAKVTEDDVRTIRLQKSGGQTLRTIGAAFGLSEATVSAICRRRTWAHVA